MFELTISLGGMRLSLWMYADEVEQFIVVARIHDNPPIRAKPNSERTSRFCDGSGERVVQPTMPRDQEPKRRLPRWKECHILDG